ncbi:Beta-galactosidase C-terminal domain, partial [Micromonospora sp. NPDC048843]|uniref:Beta-galactosidase C-terminal domain n=1 Tax=Micromonospora sp. NPDC048843 TaxID=3155389 RepID=UPI00340233A4
GPETATRMVSCIRSYIGKSSPSVRAGSASSADRLVARLLAEADVRPAASAPPGVEVVRRRDGDRTWLFAINHTDTEVRLPAYGVELLTGGHCAGELALPAGEVAVVREDRT